MNEQEILEGNKAIAEFMECPKMNNGMFITRMGGTSVGELRYHTSWNWLMPVVDKIEAFGTNFQINDDNVCLDWNGSYLKGKEFMWGFKAINKDFNSACSRHANPDAESKIEAVWLAVVAFIKWHNEHQPISETDDPGEGAESEDELAAARQ